jgi:hypothetical protein
MDDGAFPAVDCATPVPESGTDGLLASLRKQGGERFDPAGWHYLELLERRAAASGEGSVRLALEARLQRAATAFAERLSRKRSDTGALLTSACEKHPAGAVELRRIFEECDFRGLQHRVATLEAHGRCAALTELVSQLEPAAPAAAGQPSTRPTTSHARTASSPPLELKTVRESRATWARLSVDKQLSLAMKQGPANAGPINSHMLVLRSLAMMHEISPDYLDRIVSYVDTLLLLDPGEKEVPVKRKKTVSAKAAKPTKSTRKS